MFMLTVFILGTLFGFCFIVGALAAITVHTISAIYSIFSNRA